MVDQLINSRRSFGLKEIRTQIPSQREYIANVLRESIISGELQSGEQLKQDEISRKFGSSPSPVREALRDLESEGLVEHYHNRGVFVTNITNEEIVEILLPIRLVLEKFALREASALFTPRVVEELRAQIGLMKMGAKENSVQIVNEADVKFHTITMEISATHQTLQLWKSVLSRIRLQFYRLGPIPNLSLQAPEHELLLETLMTGDASVIDKALEKHIISTVVPNIKKISTVVPRP